MNEDSEICASNDSVGTKHEINFKILIPSVATGAIIGKFGESITDIQKRTLTKVKISKANELFPGTSDRICLIVGTHNGIVEVFNYILEKIDQKNDSAGHLHGIEAKGIFEKTNQTKIIISYPFVNFLLDKCGSFFRNLQKSSGVTLEISHHVSDISFLESILFIMGSLSKITNAVEMLLQKITENPQFSVSPNVSYFGIGSTIIKPLSIANSSIIPESSDSINSIAMSPNLFIQKLSFNPYFQQTNAYLNNVQSNLKLSGYSNAAVSEIITSLRTLEKYGLFVWPCLSNQMRAVLNASRFTSPSTRTRSKSETYSFPYLLSLPVKNSSIDLMPISFQLSSFLGINTTVKELEVPDFAPSPIDLITIEKQFNVSIKLKKIFGTFGGGISGIGAGRRLLSLFGAENNISQALRVIRDLVSQACAEQRTEKM